MKLVGVLADQRRDAAQRRRALGRLQPRPRPLVERAPRGGDGGVDVLAPAVRERRRSAPGRGVERRERATGDALPERPVDVVALEAEAGENRDLPATSRVLREALMPVSPLRVAIRLHPQIIYGF